MRLSTAPPATNAKTNYVRLMDVEAMLLAAASGSYEFNSHPWLGPGGHPLSSRRRLLLVACHDAWKVRPLGSHPASERHQPACFAQAHPSYAWLCPCHDGPFAKRHGAALKLDEARTPPQRAVFDDNPAADTAGSVAPEVGDPIQRMPEFLVIK